MSLDICRHVCYVPSRSLKSGSISQPRLNHEMSTKEERHKAYLASQAQQRDAVRKREWDAAMRRRKQEQRAARPKRPGDEDASLIEPWSPGEKRDREDRFWLLVFVTLTVLVIGTIIFTSRG